MSYAFYGVNVLKNSTRNWYIKIIMYPNINYNVSLKHFWYSEYLNMENVISDWSFNASSVHWLCSNRLKFFTVARMILFVVFPCVDLEVDAKVLEKHSFHL
jgi:hypothetical protein